MSSSPADQGAITRAAQIVTIVEDIAATYGALPPSLTSAVDAYHRLNAVQITAPDALAVAASASDALVDAAFAGKIDLTKVATEVEKATTAIRTADLHAELLSAARAKVARRVGATAYTSGPALVDLLREAVLPALAKVADLATVVPDGMTDALAFRSTEKIQNAWRGITAVLDVVGGAVAARMYLRNLQVLPVLTQDLDDVYGYVQNPIDTDDPRAVNGSAEWSTLPTEGRQRLLELSRRNARFWFPTSQEQDDAYAAGLEAMKAGIAQRQSGPALVRSGNAIIA